MGLILHNHLSRMRRSLQFSWRLLLKPLLRGWRLILELDWILRWVLIDLWLIVLQLSKPFSRALIFYPTFTCDTCWLWIISKFCLIMVFSFDLTINLISHFTCKLSSFCFSKFNIFYLWLWPLIFVMMSWLIYVYTWIFCINNSSWTLSLFNLDILCNYGFFWRASFLTLLAFLFHRHCRTPLRLGFR